MFNKYLARDSEGDVYVKATMSQEDAEASIAIAAEANNIKKALDDFINGRGYGNTTKVLQLTQNQYDALFSYFYANGPNVFSQSKYDEWVGYGGEYEVRAKARKALRDYIINNNGNYDADMITTLFVNSKGGNYKYDYKERRETEANEFNK